MPDFPHRVRFMGHVYPEGIKVSIKGQDITFSENTGMFKARFNISVVDSVIDITCDFDNILLDHPYSLWAQAQEITQTLVNLVAFNLGAGAITVLNRWVNQTGAENPLAFGDSRLPTLCTAVNQVTFDAITRIVFAEPGLFMALNDIVLANAMPRHVLINCARCIEAIRYLIAPPGTDRGRAWVVMQEALNVDRAYLTFITQHSQEPRHGKQTEVGEPAILEVRARTWRMMDRFFHYRLGGNNPLSSIAFPLLTG